MCLTRLRFLLVIAALLFPSVSLAQSVCPTFAPVDMFMNFNGATPGTAVSTTNLTASTEGTFSSWAGASAHQTFAASQVTLPAAVPVIGGSTHPCGFATQAVAQDMTTTFNFSQVNFTGSHQVVVLSGWVSNLPPSQSGSGQLMDLHDVLSSGSHNAVMQLVHGNGNNCASYGVEIEAPQNGVAHSNCNNAVAPAGTYFYSMIINWTTAGNCGIGQGGTVVVAPCAGEMYFSVSGTTFTQVGPTVAVSLAVSGDSLRQIYFGQDEGATCVGSQSVCTTYFQNMMVAWTNPVWPNIPQPWSTVLYPTTALNTPCNNINQTSPGQCAWDWTTAGIPGGIPSGTYTQSGSTLVSGSTSATIQNALNACGGTSSAGKYVLLAAGTFPVSSSLSVPSYCVLRGSGSNQTVLNCTIASGNCINMGGSAPNVGNRVSITGGTNAGSNVITVSSAANFAVGNLVSISQLQDGVIVNNVGSEGTCTWCDGFENAGGTRAQGQTDLITAVNGTSITLAEPLMVAYTRTPDATPYVPSAINAGVENLQVQANGTRSVGTTNGNFFMASCLYCWVSGFEGNYADGDHGYVDYSYHGMIVNSYFSNNYYHQTGQNDDSVTLRLKTTGFLIQNNIFERLMSTVETEWGASGNVVAYNYSMGGWISGTPTFLQADMNTHGAHEQFNLFEGNVLESLAQDSIWGTTANTTYFRNWSQGVANVCNPAADGRATVTSTCNFTNQANRAIDPEALNSNANMVDNVEGSAGQQSAGTNVALAIALCTGTPAGVPCGSGSRTYQGFNYNETFGYGTSSDTGTQSIDSIIPWNTAFVHGDYGTIGCPSGIRTGSTCASGITTVNSLSQTFPSSYYLPSKPTWWPSVVSFPAIGSDIVGGTGPGGHVTSLTAANPAQYCYTAVMGGSDGGPGSPLTFNPTSCYSATSAAMSLTPSSNSFGSIGLGASSQPFTFTVTNTGTVTLTLSTPFSSFTGPNASEFVVTSGSCANGLSITIGGSCTVIVTYTPVTIGAKTATLNVSGNANGQATVSGTATGPTAVLKGSGAVSGKATIVINP